MTDISEKLPNWLIWVWIAIATLFVGGMLSGIVFAIWHALLRS